MTLLETKKEIRKIQKKIVLAVRSKDFDGAVKLDKELQMLEFLLHQKTIKAFSV